MVRQSSKISAMLFKLEPDSSVLLTIDGKQEHSCVLF